MDEGLFIHPHAFKHGLSETNIRCAWENAYVSQVRTGPWPPQHVALGFDEQGHEIQLVCVWDDDNHRWVIFHAMRATKKVRKELGVE